jgi:protein-S-isoprenylcysteine O-methyltransferase Ste14
MVSARWRERGPDLIARAVVGTLFALLSVNLLAEFIQTRHLTGLWLLVSESLVVVLTVVRRRALTVDRSVAAAVVTGVSVMGPALVRTASGHDLLPDPMTSLVSSVGLLIVISGKLTLGRSFGFVPANRGVVFGGPYAIVRHPIYAGYLLTHVGFLLAHATVWNAALLIVADAALVGRALHEERLLSADDSYRRYCRRVGWHLVPGVY